MRVSFTFEEHTISYSDKGTGNAVVLLHGYLETSAVWDGFGEKLSSLYRVIAVDLPGHGQSDIFGEVHTMEFMATVVRGLLDNLGIEKVFLAGHSMGGYVTLAFLELFPEKLNGYCLFHSHPFPDTPEVLEKRKRDIEIADAGNKDLIYPDSITRMFAAANIEKFREAFDRSMEIASTIPGKGITAVLRGMMARPSRLHLMEEGKIPCLWMLGSMDNYISCESMRSGVNLPQNARLFILDNSGHMGFAEEEELSVRIVNDFIRSLD
jgi:pimeloyl-ACP methyl ester carboxylesterase